MSNEKTPGLISPQTLEALQAADKLLNQAYLALEAAGLSLTEDLAGHPLDASFDEAIEHANNLHPLYKHVWEMIAHMDDDGFELQGLIKLEKGRK